MLGLSQGVSYDVTARADTWTLSEPGGWRVLVPAPPLRIEMHRKVNLNLRTLFKELVPGEIPSMFYSMPSGLHPLRTPRDAKSSPGATFRVNPSVESLEGIVLKYTADSLVSGRFSGQIELATGAITSRDASGSDEILQYGEIELTAAFGNGTPFSGRLSLSVWRSGASKMQSTLLLDFENGRLPAPLRLPVGVYVVRPSTGSALETNAWTPFEGSRKFVVASVARSYELSIQGCPCNVTILSPEGTHLLGAYIKVMRPNAPRPSDYAWFPWRGSPDAPAARIWLSPGLSRVVASTPTLGMAEADVIAGKDGEEVTVELRLVEGTDYDPLENARRSSTHR